MRQKIEEALVGQFHVETGTFHLSCREYTILPFDWTTILGIQFRGLLILIKDMCFDMACALLGIPLPLTMETRGYFGPTTSPQIRTEWLQSSIPWDIRLGVYHLCLFHRFLEANLPARFREFGGMLADFDMVGI